MAAFNPFYSEETGHIPLDELAPWQQALMNPGANNPGMSMPGYDQNLMNMLGGQNAGVNPGAGTGGSMMSPDPYTWTGPQNSGAGNAAFNNVFNSGTTQRQSQAAPVIGSPQLATNMGMTGAENVGGMGMYTGSNGPLDTTRFTPVPGQQQNGPPPGSIPTGDPNTWITPWGATYTTPGSVNNSSSAAYDAYRQRAFGDMMGPMGRGPNTNPYAELSDVLRQVPGSINAQTFLGYLGSLQGQQTGPYPPQQTAPRPPQNQANGMAPSGGHQPSTAAGLGPYSGPGVDPRIAAQQQRNAYLNDPANASYITAITNRQGGPPSPGMQWFDGAGPYGTGAWTYPGQNESSQRPGQPGQSPVIGSPGMMAQYGNPSQYDPVNGPEAQGRAYWAARGFPNGNPNVQMQVDPAMSGAMLQNIPLTPEQRLSYEQGMARYQNGGSYFDQQYLDQLSLNPQTTGQNPYQMAAQFSSDPASQQAYLRDMFGSGQQQQNPYQNSQPDFRAATFGGGSLFPAAASSGNGNTNIPNTTNPSTSQYSQPMAGWSGATNRRGGFGGMSLFGNQFGSGGSTGFGGTQPSQYRGAGSYGRPASYGQSQRPY